MPPKIVAVAVVMIVGMPLAYYGSIFGADIGAKFSVYTGGTIREDIGFVAGACWAVPPRYSQRASLPSDRHA